MASVLSPPLPRTFRLPVSGRYLGGRLLTGLVAVWGAITLVFFALYSTGNPALLLVPPDAPPDEVERLTRVLGFDRPIPEQYVTFLGTVLTGRFPDSIRYGENPLPIALEKVPASLALGATGLLIGTLLGGLIGYWSATARSSWLRRGPLGVAVAFESVPTFFIGILLVLVFAVNLGWFPATNGRGLPGLVLPAVTLALAFIPAIARVFRTALLDVLQAEHIRTARAKGLPHHLLVRRHVVANALGTTLNVVGIQAGVMLGGAVVTESVFGWPGIGQLSINAVQNRDYPLVIVCVLVIAAGFVLINLLVDVLAALVEPRLRS
ncbi:peptide/nickel transport system permease protein [Actinoplanes lutulentus]|uniref:Peptide/nickel transport system permease protein n=1 Tax=Actinoplanes lutulentus TaxID=1287878 RepID=A0A327ZKD5_9ACTN|nr:ABC transporter permease [Actinoplanes lutulentus]MBB2940809.1 peptide/nickel transport system permease protein [Actinoplanes lutulentus]RAK43119.1 peptide/nickel transport system permease protein [Actinoplanes lutulentus]